MEGQITKKKKSLGSGRDILFRIPRRSITHTKKVVGLF